jgi:hypothetical protein
MFSLLRFVCADETSRQKYSSCFGSGGVWLCRQKLLSFGYTNLRDTTLFRLNRIV